MTNNIKQIIINAPEGKVIDMGHFAKTNEVRFIDKQPAKIEFPKEWEVENKTYFYINDSSDIKKFNSAGMASPDTLRNLIPTQTLADQILIFTQLITMRERYREIEKLNNPELGEIDWCSNKDKYCINIVKNKLTPECYYQIRRTFSFQLEEARDEFAKNFDYMILQCKNILG